MLEHMPNDPMLVIGAKSMMLAAGSPSAETRGLDVGVSVDGAAPNVHCIKAPLHTMSGMETSSFGKVRDGETAMFEYSLLTILDGWVSCPGTDASATNHAGADYGTSD